MQQSESRSSSFRSHVKANMEAGPDILLQRAGTEMPTRVRWENRSWLPRIAREGFAGLVSISSKMARSSIGRAIEFLMMAFSVIWVRGKIMGGYQLLWEEELPDGTTVRKIRIPTLKRDEDPWLVVEAARGWLTSASMAYVTHDDDGACLVIVSGAGPWLSFWKQKGLVVKATPTTAKRLKLFTRLMALIGHFEELRVQVLEAPDDKLLFDGLFYIRRSVVDRLILNCKLGKAGRKRAQQCMLFNARLLYKGGLLKGNAMIVDDEVFDQLHGSDVDVVSHVANLKPEVSVTEGFHLGLEPQPAEREVRTNLQQMLSLPQLFRPAEVLTWAKAWIRKIVGKISRGELLDTVEDLHKLLKDEEPTSLFYMARWTAFQFLSRGWSFEHSPSLVNNLFESHTRAILRFRTDLKVPVPCAWRMQILSASAAAAGGWNGQVERGQLRITDHYAVVHDDDWVEMLPSHGGCDLDDHFCLYFRSINKERKVVVLRDPSDLGEYSVFSWVPGDPYAKEEVYAEDGESKDFVPVIVSWPKADLTGAPERISEAVAGKRVKIGKLPKSELAETPAEYTQQTVLADVKRSLGGTNPGGYVNARMLQNMLCPQHGPELIASLEDVIDTCTKGGNEQALLAIRQATDAILSAALHLQLPIDRTFWKAKSFQPDRKDPTPVLVDGWWTKLLDEVEASIEAGRKYLRIQAQKWHDACGMPEPIRHQAFMAPQIEQRMGTLLNQLRFETVQISQRAETEEGFDRTAAMHEMYARYRESVGDMLPEFAYVCHTQRTKRPNKSSGIREISDAPLMSKPFFKEYMEVLGTPLDQK